MAGFEELLRRNRSFAASVDVAALQVMPGGLVLVLTCVDPRVEPAGVLGVGLGEAVVLRNVGGRVDDAVTADVAFLAAIGQAMGQATGQVMGQGAGVGNPAGGRALEVAVVHHTQCGSGFLADEGFRRGFAARTGLAEGPLAARAVTDPVASVRADVARLRADPLLPAGVVVSGHVLRLETGLVETVLPAAGGAGGAAAGGAAA